MAKDKKSIKEAVKEVFVKSKSELELLQEERNELVKKQRSFNTYLKSDYFKVDADHLALMKRQNTLMLEYISILNSRIKLL